MISRTYFFSCVFLERGRPTLYQHQQVVMRSWRDQSIGVLAACIETARSENPDKGEFFVIAFNRC